MDSYDPNADWSPSAFGNSQRLSCLVGMTPFLEQQGIWDDIRSITNIDINGATPPAETDPLPYPPMGPSPDNQLFIPWMTDIPTLRCPSDPGAGLPASGRTNYAACIGDTLHNDVVNGFVNGDSLCSMTGWDARLRRAASRGFFEMRKESKFRGILDGLSNTIAMGEILTDLGDRDIRTAYFNAGNGADNSQAGVWMTNPGFVAQLPVNTAIDPERPSFWMDAATMTYQVGDGQNTRGGSWARFGQVFSTCNTVLPPNREAVGDWQDSSGCWTMSSRHQGGAHILMGDGAVIFMTDSVDAGDSSADAIFFDNRQMRTSNGTNVGNEGAKSFYGHGVHWAPLVHWKPSKSSSINRVASS